MARKQKRKSRKNKNFFIYLQMASTAIISICIMIVVIFTANRISNLSDIDEDSLTESRENFITAVAPYAVENHKKYGIYPSITIAQAILESNWGESQLSREYNNYFGIKSFNESDQRVVLPTYEYVSGERVKIDSAFRAYDNLSKSIEHHGILLGQADRYEKVRSASGYIEAANALYEAGYATDPRYPEKIMNIIEEYNLFIYDSET